MQWFTVTDDTGCVLRCEAADAGNDRLRLAHRNYELQGWTVGALVPGRTNFIATKGARRLVIALRIVRPGELPDSRRSAASR